MEQLPRVTILMAAFNGVKWISQQLESILNQQYVSVRIVISVDPSTDGTLELCQSYATEYPCITVLPQAGPFGCAARNFFHLLMHVDLENSDYVSLADQDDVWHPGKLHRAVKHLQQSGDSGYSSNVIAIWPDGRRLLLQKAQSQVSCDYWFEAGGPGCTYVLPAAVGRNLQCHLLALGEKLWSVNFHDWFVYAWVRSQGLSWFIDPVASMDYRQHTHNQLGANNNIKSFWRRWRTISSGGWLHQVKLIVELASHESDNSFRNFYSFDTRSLIWVASHAKDCRRNRRDQLFLAWVCRYLAIRKKTCIESRQGHSG
jgi:rhamnosyltransferase